MTTAKHTSGPWSVETRHPAGIRWDTIIRSKNYDPVAVLPDAGYVPQEAEANARLIAAAPRMLAALQTLVERHAGLGVGPAWEEAFSAIAEATGAD